jgi:branched-chain amino acid transport system permease protein
VAILRQNQRTLKPLLYITGALLLMVWLLPLYAQESPNMILQRSISGIMLGGIYAIIALGIVVINKASGIFNFAHGSMMMLVAYIFFSFFTNVEISLAAAALLASATVIMVISMRGWKRLRQPRQIALGLAAVLVLTFMMTYGGLDLRWMHAITGALAGAVLTGLTIERFTIRPLIGQPFFTAVMVTLAVGLILRGVVKLIWGAQPQSLVVFSQPHPFLPGQLVRISQPITLETADLLGGNVLVDQPRFMAFALALVAFALFWVFFRFTSIGLSMRATSEDQLLAQSAGLGVRIILSLTWIIAAVLAGVAGILYVGATDSNTLETGLEFVALRAFPAVLLGGLESIGGALIGGLVIGFSEETAKLLWSGDVAENLAPYVVLMAILILRPQGLFGEKRIERV